MALPCVSKVRSVKFVNNPFFDLFNWSAKSVFSIFSKKGFSSSNGPIKHEDRVFSGIQPTGVPHLGNYAGAIRNWCKLQKKYPNQMMLSIVDLHSITVPQDPMILRQNILDMTACLLACGINLDKAIIFQQSMEKKKTVKEPSVGLLTYPILQAADIMLYKSTHVPVGEDQIHHIELTRDIIKNFNRLYHPVFPVCEVISGELPKIRSLRNPEKKMSKSEPNPKSRIELLDTPDEIKAKIKKAVTDFTSEISYDPENRPGVSNLIEIHMAVTDCEPDEIVEESYLMVEDTAIYKSRLADVVIEKLSPIRTQVLEYQSDPDFLLQVLETGAEKANEVAESTMKEVRQCIGLR